MMGSSISYKDLIELKNKLVPKIHYVTSEDVERGYVIYKTKTDYFPEFIVCHPDDLETIKQNWVGREFVHIREREMTNEELNRMMTTYNKQYFEKYYLENAGKINGEVE